MESPVGSEITIILAARAIYAADAISLGPSFTPFVRLAAAGGCLVA